MPELPLFLAQTIALFMHRSITATAQPVGTETVPVHAGDAVPIQLNEVHSFENTVGQPLEFLIVGVSRDNTRRVDSVDVSGTRRTGN